MDLRNFLSTVNTDSLVGLGAPLVLIEGDCSFIGYYCPKFGAGHLQIPIKELKSTAEQLYTEQRFPVAVHGLKRMREFFRLRDLELEHERVWDTLLMAHLLDPSRDDEHEYRLSALVREFLSRDHPYRGEGLLAKDHQECLHRCGEKDAELVRHLADALAMKMDTDLLRLYREIELPVSSVLVQMHLDGIAVDQPACANYLVAARQQLGRWSHNLILGPATSPLPETRTGSCTTRGWFLRRSLAAAST